MTLQVTNLNFVALHFKYQYPPKDQAAVFVKCEGDRLMTIEPQGNVVERR